MNMELFRIAYVEGAGVKDAHSKPMDIGTNRFLTQVGFFSEEILRTDIKQIARPKYYQIINSARNKILSFKLLRRTTNKYRLSVREFTKYEYSA